MPIPTQVFRDIERAVRDGLDLDEIEERLVKPLQLGTDLMASLWLYAWGLRERAQRSNQPDDASGK